MRANLSQEEWGAYQEEELTGFAPTFNRLGILLDKKQLHTGGERYLMSGKKLVLTGTREKDGKRIVAKASSDQEGRAEIRYEKEAHDLLQTLAFANDVLLSPEELYFEDGARNTLLVTGFIEQPKVFIARPITEQFFLALRVLEAQEGFHATTYAHEKRVKNVFPVLQSGDYRKGFEKFVKSIRENRSSDAALDTLLEHAKSFLAEHTVVIDRYAPYLAHTDLAPHNMRVSDHGIYLLDYASFHFGNKYEGWARFLNYMLVHNPELEKILSEYVRKNRGEDEYLSLRLMRVYKIGFLLDYYTRALSRTTGDLHTLIEARITLWTSALSAMLEDTPLSAKVVEAYTSARNRLRSAEEVARQKESSLS